MELGTWQHVLLTGAYECHWWSDASWKGAELHLLFLEWGKVLLLYLPFPKLVRALWFWDLNLWRRLKLALLGVRQEGKTWWDINFASFGNPGKSTIIILVLASIYVNHETSHCSIVFLVPVTWQKCKNKASAEHANDPFRKMKLGPKKLGIISLWKPNIDLSDCHWRNFLLQLSSSRPFWLSSFGLIWGVQCTPLYLVIELTLVHSSLSNKQTKLSSYSTSFIGRREPITFQPLCSFQFEISLGSSRICFPKKLHPSYAIHLDTENRTWNTTC